MSFPEAEQTATVFEWQVFNICGLGAFPKRTESKREEEGGKKERKGTKDRTSSPYA